MIIFCAASVHTKNALNMSGFVTPAQAGIQVFE